MYTIFFDHFAEHGWWRDRSQGVVCRTRVSVDSIASMDGTSMTILLSENEDAGRWIWHDASSNIVGQSHLPVTSGHLGAASMDTRPADNLAEVESIVGFCYPNILSSIATGEIPTYEPATVGGLPNNVASPLFINEGRNIGFSGVTDNVSYIAISGIRKARPSSGHPGVVVAAFVDGGVRPLRDNMDKTLFVRLARPGSGAIINPKDLGW